MKIPVCSTMALWAILLDPAGAAGQSSAWETRTDRPGSDYKSIQMARPDPKLCQAACQREGQCRAWTYVKPGVQGDAAVCWLKNEVPDPVPDDCCVSGTKSTGGPSTTLESNTDRPGGDYRDFDLRRADPKLCMAACLKESQCKAWTYVKPGVQADNARCWLKDQVPDAQPNEDCVSGVRK